MGEGQETQDEERERRPDQTVREGIKGKKHDVQLYLHGLPTFIVSNMELGYVQILYSAIQAAFRFITFNL